MPRDTHIISPAAANAIPRHHVPGSGILPAQLMLVGEAPGQRENAFQRPFVGAAGQELERYCNSANVDLRGAYITNLCKFWPPLDFRGKQLPPSREDIARDAAELAEELRLCHPRVIAAIGAHAARYFLGGSFRNMRRDHGIPVTGMMSGSDGSASAIIIPCVHPAAGLHSGNQEEMARIQWDFAQVGRALRGHLDVERADTYPDAQYYRLTDASDGAEQLGVLLAGQTVLSIDTEGTIDDPECATVSIREGEGWLIGRDERECLQMLNRHINAPHANSTVICHYLAHDIPVLAALGVDVIKHAARNLNGSLVLRDTMSELYLLGGTEPKGLKPAGWRLVAAEMDSYEEVTHEAEYAIARGYLESVFSGMCCAECSGTGKSRATYKVIDDGCVLCAGSGRVAGKRAGTTKQCSCVKARDTCRARACVDGLMIPLPERELTFDGAKGEFRWKQPQSAAKWIKRRLSKEDLLASGKDDDEENASPDPNDSNSDSDSDSDGDTEVAEYFQLRRDWRALDPALRKLIEERCGRMPRTRLADVADQSRVTRYASRDSDITLRIAGVLEGRISELGLQRVRAIDAAIIPMLSRMERVGMQIDREHFKEFQRDLERWLGDERRKLEGLVGESNPNSKRMIGVLFRDLGLPVIKLTATGQESTDDESLGILKAQLQKRLERDDDRDAELVRTGIAVTDCIQTYRELQKMKSTYVDAILERADHADRIHTTLNYTNSVSRLSSESPNLQNIPNPDNSPYGDDPVRNMGLRMRSGFIAREGYKILSCDYSSIELVVGAHLTQDRNLMRVFREGLDPHRYAASQLLDMEMAAVPKPVRTQCKCFHPDTEVLTRSGWCKIVELSPNCEIVQATPREDFAVDLSWVVPSENFRMKHPSGKLVHLRNEGIDLRVTPDHRMLAWTHHKPSKPKVVMPDVFGRSYGWANAGRLEGAWTPDVALLRLAVAAQADGSITPYGSLKFGFSKLRKITRIKQLLADAEIKYTSYPRKNASPPVTLFNVVRAEAAPILALLDNKRLPWSWLGLDQASREVVLEEAVHWDSHQAPKWRMYKYGSAIRQNAEVLQAIAVTTGRKTRLTSKPTQFGEMLDLTIRDRSWSRGSHLSTREFDYEGEVACLSVPSTFVLVRDGAAPAQVPVIVGQTLNFAAFYDTSAATLQRQFALMQPPIDKTESECQTLIDWYFSEFAPDVAEWKARVRREGQADGCVRTMFGRLRWIPGLRSQIKRVRSAAERESTNFPIQGTAGDILRIAMALLWEVTLPALWGEGIDCQPIMTVHDEMLFEVDEESAELASVMIAETMKGAVKLSVPVKVGVGIGGNWAEAH